MYACIFLNDFYVYYIKVVGDDVKRQSDGDCGSKAPAVCDQTMLNYILCQRRYTDPFLPFSFFLVLLYYYNNVVFSFQFMYYNNKIISAFLILLIVFHLDTILIGCSIIFFCREYP